MKISAVYSHMNGEEYLKVHHEDLYKDIKTVIENVDAEKCKTKVSKEKTMPGKILYSPKELNTAFKTQFETLGWTEKRYSDYITLNRDLMQLSLDMETSEQKRFLESKGEIAPISSYKHTAFVKDKVADEYLDIYKIFVYKKI